MPMTNKCTRLPLLEEARKGEEYYAEFECIDNSPCLEGEIMIIESDKTKGEKGIRTTIVRKIDGHEEEVHYTPYDEKTLELIRRYLI